MIENRCTRRIPRSPTHSRKPRRGRRRPHPRHARGGAPGARGRRCACCSGSAPGPRSAAPGRCPAATSSPGDTLERSIRAQLARKVDVAELSWLEQLETLSEPGPPSRRVAARHRLSRPRPARARPRSPADTAWHPIERLPALAFDHEAIVLAGRERLRAKLSYTNIGFALAPESLLDLRADARSTPPRSATRSTRPTCAGCSSAAACSRPPASAAPPAARAAGRRRSTASRSRDLEVTDPFAVLRPPRP